MKDSMYTALEKGKEGLGGIGINVSVAVFLIQMLYYIMSTLKVFADAFVCRPFIGYDS